MPADHASLSATRCSYSNFLRRPVQSATTAADSVQGIGGRWTGSWQNTNNTHGGALRALVEPDGGDGTRYTARFQKIAGIHVYAAFVLQDGQCRTQHKRAESKAQARSFLTN